MRKAKLVFALVGTLGLPLAVMAQQYPGGAEKPPAASPTTPTEKPGATPRGGAEGRTAPSMFQALDTNKDGYIDAKEAERSATVKGNYKALDSDGDGKISVEEWRAGGGQ